jgi:predicted transcriptional regulator
MKEIETAIILSADDDKTIEIMKECGMDRPTAKCMFYMLNNDNKNINVREIEKAMEMRQPEVSIGMNTLLKKGIITASKLPQKGKGRPSYLYSMEKDKREIFRILKNNIEKKQEQLEQSVIHLQKTLL